MAHFFVLHRFDFHRGVFGAVYRPRLERLYRGYVCRDHATLGHSLRQANRELCGVDLCVQLL